MTQQHGRRYEHSLVNGVNDITGSDVWVGTLGYSGNSASGDCDFVITVSPQYVTKGMAGQFNGEAKKVQAESGKRTTVFSGSSGDESGLGEVQRLVDATVSFADPILAIKFDHRKLVVLDARHLLYELGDTGRGIAPPDSLRLHDARLTPSDHISMRKPSLDNWESSTASRADPVVLADRLGLPTVIDDG